MKKVVICVPSLAIGGAERFAVDLALTVDVNRFKVIVAITRTNVESFLKQQLEHIVSSTIRIKHSSQKH